VVVNHPDRRVDIENTMDNVSPEAGSCRHVVRERERERKRDREHGHGYEERLRKEDMLEEMGIWMMEKKRHRMINDDSGHIRGM
jgi:hypothetical protein